MGKARDLFGGGICVEKLAHPECCDHAVGAGRGRHENDLQAGKGQRNSSGKVVKALLMAPRKKKPDAGKTLGTQLREGGGKGEGEEKDTFLQEASSQQPEGILDKRSMISETTSKGHYPFEEGGRSLFRKTLSEGKKGDLFLEKEGNYGWEIPSYIEKKKIVLNSAETSNRERGIKRERIPPDLSTKMTLVKKWLLKKRDRGSPNF